MKPLYQILVTLLLATLCCMGLYRVYMIGYDRYYAITKKRYEDIFLRTDAHDLLFLGTSRTCADIHPRVVDSICHSDSYSIGIMDGTLLEFRTALLGYLRVHPAPKILLLSLQASSFDSTRKIYKPSVYFFNVKNPEAAKLLRDEGYQPLLFRVWHPAIYTLLDPVTRSNALQSLLGDTATEIPGDTVLHYKGSVVYPTGKFGIYPKVLKINSQVVSPRHIGYLLDIISTCRERKIELKLALAPECEHLIINSNQLLYTRVVDSLSSIAARYRLPLLRHDTLGICNDTTLFFDQNHLNRQGAYLYSTVVARELMKR